MIHSLAGGVIKTNGVYDFAKVRFLEPPYNDRPYWYLCPFPLAKVGDFAYAPVGRDGNERRAEIIKMERGVNEQCAPVPMNRIRELSRME